MKWLQEIWAEALWVEQNEGAEGPMFIAEHVVALAKKGDEAGVARWRRIAESYDQLRVGTPQ